MTCFIARTVARALKFDLEDGMHIVCRARMNVYKPRGEYQLILDYAEPRGVGALQIAGAQHSLLVRQRGPIRCCQTPVTHCQMPIAATTLCKWM